MYMKRDMTQMSIRASRAKLLQLSPATADLESRNMHSQVSAAHMWMLRLGEKKHPMLAAEH